MRPIVFFAGCLLFAVTTLCAQNNTPTTAPADDAGGHWEGSIEMPGGGKLGVVIELKRSGPPGAPAPAAAAAAAAPGIPVPTTTAPAAAAAPAWSGKIDIPMQGAAGLPLERILIDGPRVSFAIKGVPGAPTFDGTLAGVTIEGTFSQGNVKLPFALSRERSVTSSLVRPQEPKPPFPYREEEVTVPAGGHTLAGTLTIPPGAGPFPCAVFITGSGAQNRDEELFGHKPFRLIADRLARAGVASLRCDDRGAGKSTGEHKDATSNDFARDVEAQVAFLRTRSDVDKAAIGLIGHSEGGLIAPIVAAARPEEVRFVVLLAAPGVPGDQVLSRQLELLSKAMGMSQEQVNQAREAQADVLATLKESRDAADAEPRLREAIGRAFDAAPAGLRTAMGDKDDFVAAQLEQVNTPWMRSFVAHDPRPTLREVKQPVLAVWGGLDLQVDPEQNAGEVEEALRGADNADVTLKILNGLNHLLQPAQTGSLTEYGEIETTMDESALEEIVGWVKQRFVK